MSRGMPIAVRVGAIDTVADDIKRFTLERPDGGALPLFSPGSHITVEIPVKGQVRRNPYSLMGGLDSERTYQISVLRVANSRGGSHHMHDAVAVGDVLHISEPANLFQQDSLARRHVLIAGGIGITPFLPMIERFSATFAPFELHYAVRSRGRAAYAQDLAGKLDGRLALYIDDEGGALNLPGILSGQPLGTHLYVCGPEGMIQAVQAAARAAGWEDEYVHSERFAAPPVGASFELKLARSAKTVTVAAGETILEAAERSGAEPLYLCRGGACGQCETAVIAHEGAIEHNDHYLTDEEKATNRKIMICVSRLVGRSLTIDI